MTHVPRADRPERYAALAALQRFLAANPALRVGQALFALAKHSKGTDDVFCLEDEDIIEAVAAWEAKR